MLNFLNKNWLFLVLLFGSLMLITAAYLLFIYLKRPVKKKNIAETKTQKAEKDELKISLIDLIDAEITGQKSVKKKAVQTDVSSHEAISEVVIASERENENADGVTSTIPMDISEVSPTENVPQEPILTGEAEEKPLATDPPRENTPSTTEKSQKKGEKKPPKKELGKYHVLFRKKDGRWYVKREGSERILRVLDTQKEAIAYATIKAITQNTAFVVHRQDGKIKKQ
ncbi:MAG: DUF2188 domain-containing protein [Candidatus Izemoplasmatales bacterium]|jgi:hypothetical protein